MGRRQLRAPPGLSRRSSNLLACCKRWVTPFNSKSRQGSSHAVHLNVSDVDPFWPPTRRDGCFALRCRAARSRIGSQRSGGDAAAQAAGRAEAEGGGGRRERHVLARL